LKKLSLTEAQIVAILREADKRERRIPQLRRVRGSGLYECAGCGYQASVTAWLLRRKITNAMRRGEHELLLGGVVELDKSLVSGRAPARDRRRERQNPDQGRRRPDPARQHRQERRWSAYRALPDAGCLHEPHPESTPQAAGELLPWVHIVTLQLQALATRGLPWRQRRAPAVLPRRLLLPA